MEKPRLMNIVSDTGFSEEITLREYSPYVPSEDCTELERGVARTSHIRAIRTMNQVASDNVGRGGQRSHNEIHFFVEPSTVEYPRVLARRPVEVEYRMQTYNVLRINDYSSHQILVCVNADRR